jgi:hypothetical protein
MFIPVSTIPQHCPAARIRPGRELRGARTTLPSSRVHTSTRKPVNFIRRALLCLPPHPHPVNRFVRQHVNSAARYQGNLSSPEGVNLFPPELPNKLAGNQVSVFTGKRANQFHSKPVNPQSGSHTNTKRSKHVAQVQV